MSKFNFDQMINRKGTNSIKWDIVPEGVLPFGIADMDFSLAPVIQESIIDYTRNGIFGYTLEDKELKDILVKWLKDSFGEIVESDWLVMMSGIVPAFDIGARMSKGDILTVVPNYSMLMNVTKKTANLLESPMIITDTGYEIDFENMQSLVTSNTDQFLFCNPHNPLGKVYSKKELEQLSDFCQKNNMIIISDEAHCDIVFDGKHTTMISVSDYAKDNSITYFSPGKTYNMAGLPFAFALIPNKELRDKFVDATHLTSPALLSRIAAKAAYTSANDWKEEVLVYLKNNRDFAENFLTEHFPKAKWHHLEATYLMWVDFREYVDEPANWILENAKVSLSNGAGFAGPGYVRINIASQLANLEEALNRIKEAFDTKL